MDTYLHVLEEAEGAEDSKSHLEGASGDSLDQQVDKYLGQYESDAKKSDDALGAGDGMGIDLNTSQMESMDWRDLVKGVIIEAGQEDKDSQDAGDAAPGADEMTGADDKPGLDSLDVAKFADDVVRLIENYDSLLEVRSTLHRRAKAFLAKNYSEEVVNAFDDVMRDDHGMEAGKDKFTVDAERYPAPSAERASGSAEPGAGGGGGGAGA
jgi:hypothetical protein